MLLACKVHVGRLSFEWALACAFSMSTSHSSFPVLEFLLRARLAQFSRDDNEGLWRFALHNRKRKLNTHKKDRTINKSPICRGKCSVCLIWDLACEKIHFAKISLDTLRHCCVQWAPDKLTPLNSLITSFTERAAPWNFQCLYGLTLYWLWKNFLMQAFLQKKIDAVLDG